MGPSTAMKRGMFGMVAGDGPGDESGLRYQSQCAPGAAAGLGPAGCRRSEIKEREDDESDDGDTVVHQSCLRTRESMSPANRQSGLHHPRVG